MPKTDANTKAAGAIPRRLCHVNLDFLRDRRLRRILSLADLPLCAGRPGPEDAVLVWGHGKTAARGEAWAARYGAPLWRAEDAFLRSVKPGRMGGARLGLMLDPTGGVHYDGAAPSMLEQLLATHPLDNPDLLQRARDARARIQSLHLSKYNMHDAHAPHLFQENAGYVLVVDQTRDDASIRHGNANARTFHRMLTQARQDHPTAQIMIKTHPESHLGLRPGHFSDMQAGRQISLWNDPISPWTALQGAKAVYTVSSQLGFEAILAGHRPHVFGQPFYAGWGLSIDHNPVARRTRRLNADQLFAAAMILAPIWYDPCRDRLCDLDAVIDQLEAETRAWRQDRKGYVATAVSLWKRDHFQRIFGKEQRIQFVDEPKRAVDVARKSTRPLLVWGEGMSGVPNKGAQVLRVEDGFLRSRGLGAELVPPLSLVVDGMGIYYDPMRPSLFDVIMKGALTEAERARSLRLIGRLCASGITKYNLNAPPLPSLPSGHRILVPGQVEDDASIRLGAGDVRTNLALLQAVRAAHPTAVILYKPHPDVTAGLRPGIVPQTDLAGLADFVLRDADPVALIDAVDEVWTMTSTLGFEALIRNKPVTCLGMPFYAGWGLTRDLWPAPTWRGPLSIGQKPLDLAHLVHAALIAYPRYHDPVSNLPCPPEVILERLASGIPLPRAARLRLMAKLQGRLASQSWLWRG